MKSLTDIRKQLTKEGHVATTDFYLNNIVDPYTGKITLKKTRKGYMDLGHDTVHKYTGIPPKVGEKDPVMNNEAKKVVVKKPVNDPPMVLVLKRQGIRYYPNNTKIALYYSDKLKQHFSVPYSEQGYGSPIQSENILDKLTPEMSELYNCLTEENQIQMLNKLFESDEEFNKIANFAKYWKEQC